MLYDTLIAPFADLDFMRRALAGAFALAFSAPPIGVFLMLRRMSLIGDAHVARDFAGRGDRLSARRLSVFAMAGGGLIAGFLIAFGAGLIARATPLKEDASLAAFFLISLALGVTIVSVKGSNVDLVHFLFGSVLDDRQPALLLIAGITTVSLSSLALIWRPLVLECVDPGFLRSVSRAGGAAHIAFLALVVLNLVGGFQALGTLLAVGIMMLPAVIVAVLGARHHRHDRGRGRLRGDLGLCAACWFPTTPACPSGPPSSWSRASFMRCRSCSVRSAAWSGSLCRSAISKPKRGASAIWSSR